MKSTTILRGITWNHTRGYLPMIATAQRFTEMYPDVEIQWEKRSLQEFADYSLDTLTSRYDLLVIDHPWTGYADAHRLFLPLNEYLSGDFLEEQEAASVGLSHSSYRYNGRQLAIAIDAAAPVASYRPDLMAEFRREPPQTWPDLMELASLGVVITSGVPIDLLMKFYMFCLFQDAELFGSDEQVVPEEIGVSALMELHELMSLLPPECLHWNPISVYEMMTTTDRYIYCPFAYGYSNYSRPGYSQRPLVFTEMPEYKNSQLPKTTLGGAGLALAKRAESRDILLAYLRFVANRECQQTLYFESGGQPAHRSVWGDPEVNQRCANFFRNTLAPLDRAYLRPRYAGYIGFQDWAGLVIRDYLLNKTPERQVIQQLNSLYSHSRSGNGTHVNTP